MEIRTSIVVDGVVIHTAPAGAKVLMYQGHAFVLSKGAVPYMVAPDGFTGPIIFGDGERELPSSWEDEDDLARQALMEACGYTQGDDE